MTRLLLIFCAWASTLAAGETLRILCWNIHHGVGLDGRSDLERIAKVIRSAKPDVVALQEVDQRCSRSGNVDQTAELARMTGMTGHFGSAMDFGGGQYGLAILSKHPVLSAVRHALPGPGEPRMAWVAEISWKDRRVRIANTHLDLTEETRLRQAKHLAGLPHLTRPLVICGDFNAPPEEASMRLLAGKWRWIEKSTPRFTHPADAPGDEIDHFFCDGFKPVAPAKVIHEAVTSDHRPILVDLEPAP